MRLSISNLPTVPPEDASRKACQEELEHYVDRIAELQHLLYAEAKRSLLVIFQGMDGSGKDGTTSAVFRNCAPHGVHAFSFKKPTSIELAHDFLWRVHMRVPEKGYVHIFNRSHYEDVLIQRVHGWIDLERYHIRMRAINAFEELLEKDGQTTVVKIFLHISEARQLEKLQERLDNPKKQWKHNAADWEERKRWQDYMACYEDVLNESTIPWHVVPADSEWYRNHSSAKVVLDTLERLNPKRPHL